MSYKLFLQYDAAAFLHLDGASTAAPVKGARYSPGQGLRQRHASGRALIREEIIIELAGSYRQITDWITAVSQQVELWAAGAWHKPGQAQLWLCVQEPDAADGLYWHSQVMAADLVLDPAGLAQRALGHQWVKLTITRLDRWVYIHPGAFDLTLADGITTQSGQGYLLNHTDAAAGHSNWGYVPAAHVTGGLPSESYLYLMTTQAGRSLGDVYIGCGWTDDPDPAYSKFVNTLQDSDFAPGGGVVKTPTASAASAGGSYAAFTWAAAGEVLLCKAAIPPRLYAAKYSHGRPFKPMGRLQGGLAASEVYLQARVLLSGSAEVVYKTEWVHYPSGAPLLELPPVYLPPEGVVEGQGLDLALYVLRQGTTSCTLNLDFVQLWPVDGGFRKLKALAYQAGSGQVVDDGLQGLVYWKPVGVGNERAAYYGLGASIQLFPGRVNVLAVANIAGGSDWLIDDQLFLWLNAAPVKREL